MEFGILGPLLVTHNGRPVPIGGRHKPKLLALLLIEAPYTVPTTSLVDELWSDPPETARRQVQNSMSALRRDLTAVAGTEVIDRVGDGYRINTRDTDTARFARHTVAARDALRDNDPATALTELDTALGLWRGSACTGLTGPGIDAAARRLEESWLAAREDRFDAAMALGEHTESVGELRELMTAHPHRQRVAGQLMRALHGSGRTSEALEVFADLRVRLTADLGIDPERRLRDLHAAILREDDSLAVPEPAPSAKPEPVRPAQLPAAPTGFTGRDEHLDKLDRLDHPDTGVTLATVFGIGGAGKTGLAVHWGHTRRERFPDGQLYANLRGFDSAAPVDPLAILQRFLHDLGQPAQTIPSDLESAAALYRSLLRDRRILILLDNAHSAAQVRPLLPATGSVFTVVTSRNRLAGLVASHSAKPIKVDSLPPGEAVELLTGMIGDPDLVADSELLRKLAVLCGRLPLALRVAAALLTGGPPGAVAELVDRLSGKDRTSSLTVDEDPSASVAASFDLSISALDDDARALIRRLGEIPGEDFPTGLAEALTDHPAPMVHRILARLVSACLLERPHPDRYRFHDLIRDHLQFAESPEPAERGEVTERIIDWFGADPMPPFWVEYDNLAAAFRRFHTDPVVWRLAKPLARSVLDGAGGAEAVAMIEKTLPGAEAVGPAAAARAHAGLTLAEWARGNFASAAAHGKRAVRFAREAGDARELGVVTSNLALVAMSTGDFDAAEKLLAESLRIATEQGDTRFILSRTGNLTKLYRMTGRYADAEPLATKVLGMIDNGVLGRRMRLSVAMLYLAMGRYPDAEKVAAPILDHTDTDRPTRAMAIFLLSEVDLQAGRLDASRDRLTGLLNDGALHFQDSDSEVLWRLAWVEIAAGRIPRARELLARASGPDLKRDDLASVVVSYLSGLASLRAGELERGLAEATAASDGLSSVADPLWHARVAVLVLRFRLALGDTESAAAQRVRAQELAKRLGTPAGAALLAEIDGM